MIKSYKVGSILLMVVVSMLPHAEIGGNDHREDAPQFIFLFRMSSRDATRDSDSSISDSSHDDMLEDEQLNTLAETKRTREQGKS